MFSGDGNDEIPEAVSNALDVIFLLHADHEQNCSTSTCRMIVSGGANLFASVAGAISALWGAHFMGGRTWLLSICSMRFINPEMMVSSLSLRKLASLDLLALSSCLQKL